MLHVGKTDETWFHEQEAEILQELCDVLRDNIALIQQQVHQSGSSSTGSGNEAWYQLQGHSIRLKYATRRKAVQYDSIMRFDSLDKDSTPETMSLCSFSLNPLYLCPINSTLLEVS